MKTWDPLSVFKYLNGSPTIHFTMFLILACTAHKFEIESEKRPLYKYNLALAIETGKELREEKNKLIHLQLYVHLFCFLIHMIFDAGIVSVCCCKGKELMLTPAVSLFA